VFFLFLKKECEQGKTSASGGRISRQHFSYRQKKTQKGPKKSKVTNYLEKQCERGACRRVALEQFYYRQRLLLNLCAKAILALDRGQQVQVIRLRLHPTMVRQQSHLQIVSF
jgi:hypothetical protein